MSAPRAAAAAAADRESALRAQLDARANVVRSRSARDEGGGDALGERRVRRDGRAETRSWRWRAAQERENELRALLDPAFRIPVRRAKAGVAERETPGDVADPRSAEDASTASAPDAPPPSSVAETLAAALEAAGLREGLAQAAVRGPEG